MFFDGWDDVTRVVVSGLIVYAALVALLRASGKRTLAQLNMFDWVVTVAMGSIVATTLVSADVAVLEGLAALGVLVASQYVVAFVSRRSARTRRFVTGEPALLLHRGRLLHRAMRRERITEEEVLQALRQHSVASLEAVEAVVLETNGSLAVITRSSPDSGEVLAGLRHKSDGER